MPGKTTKEIPIIEGSVNVLDYWMNALQQDSIQWAMAIAQQALATTDQSRSDWTVTAARWQERIDRDHELIRRIVEDARKEIPGGF